MSKIKPTLIFCLWSLFLFALSGFIIILLNVFYSDNSNMLKLDIAILEVLVLFVSLELGFMAILMKWGQRIKWMQDLVQHTEPSRHHRRHVHRFVTGTRWNFIRPNQVPNRPARAPTASPVALSLDSTHTYENLNENNTVIVNRNIDSLDNTRERNNQSNSSNNDANQAGVLQISHKNKKTVISDNVQIQIESLDIGRNTNQIGTVINDEFHSKPFSKLLKKQEIDEENHVEIQASLKIEQNIENGNIKSNNFNITNITIAKNGLSYSVHFPKSIKLQIQIESPDIGRNTNQIGTAINNEFHFKPFSRWLKKMNINGENNVEIQAHSTGLESQSNSNIKLDNFTITNIIEAKNSLSYSVHFPKSIKPVKKTSPVLDKVSRNVASIFKASSSIYKTFETI